MAYYKYDAATGEKSRPLQPMPVSYPLIRELEAHGVPLPDAVREHLAEGDKVGERLAVPELTSLPMPGSTADEQAITEYRNSLVRAQADKTEREATNLEQRRCWGRAAKAAGVHLDELFTGIELAAKKLISKPKVSQEDVEEFAWLGQTWARLLLYAFTTRNEWQIQHTQQGVGFADGSRKPLSFVGARLQFPWTSALIWERPEDAVSAAVPDRFAGLPSLGDVKLSADAGFKLASVEDAVRLARYINAIEYDEQVKSAGGTARLDIADDVLTYIEKQITAKGSVSPDYLFQ